jgi:hypothetical protein
LAVDANTRLFDSEIECLVVGAPARPVGADDAVIDLGDGEIRIETPEAAYFELFLVVHAAGEEPAAPIDLAVIEPRARLVGVYLDDQIETFGVEIVKIEAIVGRQRRAAAAPQGERTDVTVERPMLDLALARIVSPQRRLADAAAGAVDPVKPAFLDIPDRAFAEVIAARDHAFDGVRHEAVPSARSPVPRGWAGGEGGIRTHGTQ